MCHFLIIRLKGSFVHFIFSFKRVSFLQRLHTHFFQLKKKLKGCSSPARSTSTGRLTAGDYRSRGHIGLLSTSSLVLIRSSIAIAILTVAISTNL
ncbi:hypothetical protein HanIR_Chr11g0556001 [Helianthus annuus]|nr:hypothetical protein HanIR_Chr11g0556001 [Helianthus annuus]